MNNMFPVWTLSSLILSYTLAFPVFNNSSRGSMETFPNVTENMEYNKTRLMGKIETPPTGAGAWDGDEAAAARLPIMPMSRCPFGTCALHRLVHEMQNGDEEAGNTAQDPFGPGKK